jgi:hypothetical protein
MTIRMPFQGPALSLSALLLGVPGAAQSPAVEPAASTSTSISTSAPTAAPSSAPTRKPAAKSQAPRPKARLYTNVDLERIHPFAAQTGAQSVPSVAPEESEAARLTPPEPVRGRGEAYWRAEAARVRERLRALEQRAVELRTRIAERESQPQVFGRRGQPSGASGAASLRAALAALERRSRLTSDDLEERARRDYALPGWLR